MKRDVARAWRWFTAEDALRWSLAAYYQACRDVEPPDGEPDPENWSSAAMFAHSFHRAITQRICREAAGLKIPDDSGCSTEPLSWSDLDFSRLPGNGLHYAENAPDNPATSGAENA